MRHLEVSAEEGVSLAPRRWRAAVIAVALATLFGLIFASQHYVYLRARGQTASIDYLLAIHLARWYLWVALSPLIFAIARRWRLGDSRRAYRLAVQGVAAVGFALAHAVLSALVERAIGVITGPLPFTLTAHISALFAGDILTYGGIVAVYHAIEYYHRYRQRELRASQLATRLAQAQLQMLRMQLHPHFLFNTLNTVSSLMHQDVESADAMLTELSELLRLALRGDAAQEVPLRQEVEFVQRYLGIMRIRFGNRLATSLEIDPAALDALVPTLMLQPLVENAVHHGAAKRLDGGRVEIRVERVNGDLRVRIIDDGPGLPPDWDEERNGGVGLRNTRARLRQLYGDSHRLDLANRPTGGVELTLTVPFRTAATAPTA
jgi:signal transduction histidine kinase